MASANSRHARFNLIWILLLILAPSVALAAPYQWIQVGGSVPNLGAMETKISQLPQKVRPKARICIEDGRYRLVLPGSNDPNAAKAGMERLSGRIPGMHLAQIDQNHCFFSSAMLEQPGTQKPKPRLVKIGNPVPINREGPVHIVVKPHFGQQKDAGVPNVSTPLSGTSVNVLPEITTRVFMSNTDVNRVTCMGGVPVKDVVFSNEKGITTKVNGSNVFVKFKVRENPNTLETEYITEPVELYVICGRENTVYTLITVPRKLPAQWVRLGGVDNKKIEKNLSLFQGQSFEEKVLKIMKQAYRGDYPDSYTVKEEQRQVEQPLLKQFNIRLQSVVSVDGEGLKVKVFDVSLAMGVRQNKARVEEKTFLPLGHNVVAIALGSLVLRKDHSTRLFILEQSKDQDQS
jgi:conjugal transfer pilus assembly protein TraK